MAISIFSDIIQISFRTSVKEFSRSAASRVLGNKQKEERFNMTEMSLAELKRVRLRRQKRNMKSKRRKDIAKRKMVKKKLEVSKKLATRKKRR